MPNHSTGAGVLISVAMALGVGACSEAPTDPGQETNGTGTVLIPLTAQSGETHYRLASARFAIQGSGVSRVITPPADLPVHQETLPAGGYEIKLDSGWRLEKRDPTDASFVEIPAELISSNPIKFKVLSGRTLDVVFTFATNGGKVDLKRGRANVRIDVQDCDSYNAFAATIATSVVDCLGTIGPRVFMIDDRGFLRRAFDECQDPETERDLLDSIDAFLGLQYPPELAPRELPDVVVRQLAFAQDCVAGRWTQWKEAFDESGITECPVWRKIEEFGVPDPETYARYGEALPTLPSPELAGARPDVMGQLSISALYAASYENDPPDQQCGSPGECAQRCAEGFPGFVIEQNGETVLTDPPPWQRAMLYTDTDNPFVMPYYHPMSLYGDLPGAIISHANRADQGDACSYFDGEFHIELVLKKDCALMPDGTTSCVGYCAP